ncbi:MAG TPA: hypothetical protein VIE43_26365 [Thermoanaerobaculia bacterium]|jgi:hypothetical protein|nr:hypothetical protein [Thermoanaerobaculia bacterium]
MPELPEVYPTPPDLTRYTESTRRDLYDRLVAIQFTAPDPATVEHPEDVFTPYDPDAAGLVIFHVLGRWFATWTDLDAAPELPEMVRGPVLPQHHAALLTVEAVPETKRQAPAPEARKEAGNRRVVDQPGAFGMDSRFGRQFVEPAFLEDLGHGASPFRCRAVGARADPK